VIPTIVFVGLRYLFIALLFIFLILVIRAIYRDLRSPEIREEKRGRKKKKQPPQLAVVAADRNMGARYRLSGEINIGRDNGAGIVIDDTYASQQHARVFPQGERFMVEDLGSTNGTYVNGRRISYPVELRDGDRVKIGKTVFEYRC
jgi:pSer/pThr/pTyr-binding forkhead associated (FHA) protein